MDSSTTTCGFPFYLEIQRLPGLNLTGRPLVRHAVRAIVIKDGRLLMVYSAVNGDYKFPGGGMETGELHEQTLLRELREETGFNLRNIKCLAGTTVEFDRVREKNYDVFKMYSYYYLCRIKDEINLPSLEPYEADLGFTAAWVCCRDALENNQRLMATNNPENPRWLKRETAVLGIVNSIMGLERAMKP